MNLTMKLPPSIRAAAELEMRRRQQTRAKDCYRCNHLYAVAAGLREKPEACPHSREEQDIQSERNQSFIDRVELIYGGGAVTA